MTEEEHKDKALVAFVEECRKRIGVQSSVAGVATLRFNEEATRDTIRHYAWGIMDLNPLWVQDRYARGARFGNLVAPPTFLYSVMLPSMATRTIVPSPDVRWTQLYGGTTWRFERPVVLGDEIHVSSRILGADIKTLKTGQRAAIAQSEVRYFDAWNKLLATAVCPVILFPAHNLSGAYEEKPTPPDGSARLVADLLAPEQYRRGAEPLLWDDVVVGDVLPELPKGRLRILDIIRWNSGSYGPFPLPSRILPSGERSGEGHYVEDLAKEEGLPGLYDNGPLRGGWLGEVVTNWMGDWGDLVELSYQLRRLNVVGDVNVGRGVVTAKREPGIVTVDIWIENHCQQRTAVGNATVRLPTRNA